ncbi:hypothetical protein, partial [Acidiphilium sp.]|uniref:hypothetical protein n=1 Tax=Acidiphilium sp. TaxID=527 RepID=UPI003D07D41E
LNKKHHPDTISRSDAHAGADSSSLGYNPGMNTATPPTDTARHTQIVADGRRMIDPRGQNNARPSCKSFDHDGFQAAGHQRNE